MERNAEKMALDIILCGNPGVGKSTLLSSISNKQFDSGISFGEGLTSSLSWKENDELPGVRFGDTPGLADIHMAERAAQAITSALQDSAKKGRETSIFFVVTIESGRVSSADLFTIKTVLGSIKLLDDQEISANNYGVIVNKCTLLNNHRFISGGKEQIEAAFCNESQAVPYTSSYIKFLPSITTLLDQDNVMLEFGGLKEWIFNFPTIKIASAALIDVSNLEKKLREAKENHTREMADIERRLNGTAQEAAELRKAIKDRNRDMEKKMQACMEIEATHKMSGVTIRSRLEGGISDIKVIYGQSSKSNSLMSYIYDWFNSFNLSRRNGNVDVLDNTHCTTQTITFERTKIGQYSSATEDYDIAFHAYRRGYWQVFFTYKGDRYMINKNNAGCNPWPQDHGRRPEITIVEERGRIRLDFFFSSFRQAHFYALKYEPHVDYR